MSGTRPFPAETEVLDEADRLIAWMFRHWVIGHGDQRHWSLVWRELAAVYGGETASEVVTALSAVVRAICEHARRGFVYHQPCCPSLAADEYRLIAFLDACRRQELRRAAGLAQWMVRSDGVAELIEAGARLSRLIASAGPPPAQNYDDAPGPLDEAERPHALADAADRS